MPSMNVLIPELIEPIELNKVVQMVVPGECYREGDSLFIYENIFSGNRRRLRSTCCDGSLSIEIYNCDQVVILNNRLIDDDEKETLAKHCGFASFEIMLKSYVNSIGPSVIGQLVRWL